MVVMVASPPPGHKLGSDQRRQGSPGGGHVMVKDPERPGGSWHITDDDDEREMHAHTAETFRNLAP